MRYRIANIIIVFLVISIILWLVLDEYANLVIHEKTAEYSVEDLSITNEVEEIKIVKEYPKEEVIAEYKGYDVAAKLAIPKIELETYILKNFSENALNVSVTKFWGAEPNTAGNMCVAGHNFKNKNMFRNLRELEKGDTFTVSDNNVGKVAYEIYDIYTVLPEDISCLAQDTNNTKEVTLITCTRDSKHRIIIKAREKLTSNLN